ncbi:hypothetical protein IscW_ISCW017143 [Ixodes scapularis]|uniref:Uncharacterized protein n=1 Tax=Ixodes scapularis TaxID=6945 RepID=B7PAA2_IXOSC|nr:hypothetical protein IscW_ISCW017143 [Ixodes scapularis]|eukprot:XP_002406671.1 hypothetical protein IscW_ISCW017143 [Ixodes scapularis]
MEGQDSPRSPEPDSQEATSLTLPSELDYTFKTAAETTPGELEQTTPGELEQTLYFDALNVGGTMDAEERSRVCVKKQPEVDVLPDAVEGTDVCTAANEPQPQDFEAGPEVAQISKEESLSFAASLKDPSDLDFLPKVASSGRLQKTHLGRRSTLLKFDPLLSELRPVYQSSVHPIEEQQPEEQQPSALNSSTDSGERLIDLTDSPMKEPVFSQKEMTQALKCQEQLFQERLLNKDQDCMNEQDKLREEFPERIQRSNQMLHLLGAKTVESPEVDSEEFED